MVVIYTQDATYIRNDVESAKDILCQVYGEKLGKMAFESIRQAPIGTSFRKNGGPLVQLVSDSNVELIKKREAEINMLQ